MNVCIIWRLAGAENLTMMKRSPMGAQFVAIALGVFFGFEAERIEDYIRRVIRFVNPDLETGHFPLTLLKCFAALNIVGWLLFE